MAKAQVLQIQRELETPLQITADLARLNAQLGLQDANGSPLLSISREELSALVRATTEQNPKLLGTYIGWEANAFDASDDLYAGETGNGYDGSGRFLPWWYRNADGSLGVDALGTMESETLLPTGVREGEYYLCAKERKRACVVDPAPYEVGGKTTMLAQSYQYLLDSEVPRNRILFLSVEDSIRKLNALSKSVLMMPSTDQWSVSPIDRSVAR